MASVMTSGSVSKAGRPAFGGSEECSSFHQSSTNTYNETKKESRSSMAPSFGESLVHQHTILAPSLFFAITHQTSKGLFPTNGGSYPFATCSTCSTFAIPRVEDPSDPLTDKESKERQAPRQSRSVSMRLRGTTSTRPPSSS